MATIVKENYTYTLDTIESIASVLLTCVEKAYEKRKTAKAAVLFLSGDLGAGKTTLVQEIGKLLHVEEKIISPTFILKSSYKVHHECFDTLIHIDAYRFENKDESKVLKIERDIDNAKNLIIIEWPHNMHTIKPSVVADIITIDEDTRSITLHYEK